MKLQQPSFSWHFYIEIFYLDSLLIVVLVSSFSIISFSGTKYPVIFHCGRVKRLIIIDLRFHVEPAGGAAQPSAYAQDAHMVNTKGSSLLHTHLITHFSRDVELRDGSSVCLLPWNGMIFINVWVPTTAAPPASPLLSLSLSAFVCGISAPRSQQCWTGGGWGVYLTPPASFTAEAAGCLPRVTVAWSS